MGQLSLQLWCNHLTPVGGKDEQISQNLWEAKINDSDLTQQQNTLVRKGAENKLSISAEEYDLKINITTEHFTLKSICDYHFC